MKSRISKADDNVDRELLSRVEDVAFAVAQDMSTQEIAADTHEVIALLVEMEGELRPFCAIEYAKYDFGYTLDAIQDRTDCLPNDKRKLFRNDEKSFLEATVDAIRSGEREAWERELRKRLGRFPVNWEEYK